MTTKVVFPEMNLRPGDLSPSQGGRSGPLPRAQKAIVTPQGLTGEGRKGWEMGWERENKKKVS